MDEPLLTRTRVGEIRQQSTTTTDSINTVLPTRESSCLSYLTILKRKRHLTRRSHSAPSLFTNIRYTLQDSLDHKPPPSLLIVSQALIGLVLYVVVGIAIFVTTDSFKGKTTFKILDALYYSVVTLCTIGYGDLVPDSTFTKLFTCVNILVGFGLIDILLNCLVMFTQEPVLLSTRGGNRLNTMLRAYMIDKEKGRMRARTKLRLALGVVIGCITIGTIAVHLLENMSWVDSVYLSVTSVTTVGYGNYAFQTVTGRWFAVFWLFVSTLAVARSFLYLAQFRIDKRNRRTANWVLHRKITLGDLVAADLDNDGSISKSEFVICKLKEMRKIADEDIFLIGKQFDMLDSTGNGKITLADLMEVG